MTTQTVQVQRVRTRPIGIRDEPRSSEPVRLLRAVIAAAEERAEALRRALGQEGK